MPAFNDPRDTIPSGISTTGVTGTVMCNLPHGFDAILRDAKSDEPKARVVFRGQNAPVRHLVDTDTTDDGRWGVTKNVSKEFWDAWRKQHSWLTPVVRGNIFFVEGAERAMDMADEMRDAVSTGTNRIDPDKPASNITKADTDDGGKGD